MMKERNGEREVLVGLEGREYAVCIGEGILGKVGRRIARTEGLGKKCLLLSDSNVMGLYGERVRESLEAEGIAVVGYEVPAGEESKSLRVAEECIEAMVKAKLDRKSFVVALGGGVVGDLAGFLAGVYFRGIPFVQIPTTIVAQVDSAVGGKTGVNARGGKNLIGVFHQPKLVWVDPETLKTLGEREFSEGFAEIVKHGVIRDAGMLDRIRPGERSGLTELLAENVRIKAAIVAEDEREEKDVRALLNFGHTVGHAIENAVGYGEWFHGEAVSLGMAVALRLSRKYAGLTAEEEEKVLEILRLLHLPVRFPKELSVERVLEVMKVDKKFACGKIRFVLTPKLGEAFVSGDVTEEAIAEAIQALR